MEVRQILLRTDTAANWASVNPVLGAGEIGTESDTTLLKVGDGATAWNALSYSRIDLTVSRDGTTVTVGATGTDAVLPVATTSLAGVMSAADKTKLDGITAIGDAETTGNNTFTGVNSFLNSSGQTFGTDVATEDGIVIAGRGGGTEGYRVTLQPEALSGNRQLSAPDRSGTIITSADSGTVTGAMIANGAITNDDINASAGIADSKLATISTAGKVANSATTATDQNTASAIVARDASGNFSAGTITAALSGNASTATTLQNTRTINGVSFNGSANITIAANTGNSLTFNNGGSGGASGSTFNGGSALTVSHNTVGAPSTTGSGASGTWSISVTGNAATATALSSSRSFALTGDVTGTVNSDLTSGASISTAIAAGVIVNADINASAGIVDTKLATITTAGKVANSATTATSANTANAIVARDANGGVGIASINGGPLAGFRNLLINGNPVINQRAYVSGTNTTGSNQYTLDRWRVVTSGQNITFSDSAGVRTVTAPAGGVEQVIEAGSILGGTYTLSWTGTATATVNGASVVSGGTVTLTGNATATVRFSSGTFSLAQLEVGSVATPFELRPFGVELGLCQRYFCTMTDNELQGGSITRRYAAASTTYSAGGGNFPVEMRIAPTATIPTITYTNGNADSLTLLISSKGVAVRLISSAAGTFIWASTNPFLFDAEL